jgi:hypothetical protein
MAKNSKKKPFVRIKITDKRGKGEHETKMISKEEIEEKDVKGDSQ